VKLIRTLYLEKERKKGTGKRLNSTDVKIMTAAEKLLHEEFAVVLGIEPKDVVPHILAQLS
jgi:RNA polymerase-interacting CarD/CdnL/TRCF family regulator